MEKGLPPEVERFFAEERRKQNTYATIAQTQRNLKETTVTMHQIMEKTSQRGIVLEEREEQAEELLESSDAFYIATMPGWKRYIYEMKMPWWFHNLRYYCCCCRENKRKKHEYL